MRFFLLWSGTNRMSLKIGMHLFCLLCDVKKTTPYVSFKITYDYLFSKVHQSEWLTPDTLKVFRRIPKWGPIMMRLSNPARLTSEGTYGNLWGIWFFQRTPLCLSTITIEIFHDNFRYSKSTVATSGADKTGLNSLEVKEERPSMNAVLRYRKEKTGKSHQPLSITP